MMLMSTYKVKGFEDVYNKAIEVFGDKDKALQWYMTKSEIHDNQAPYELCRAGKCAAMFRFLEKMLI